MNKIFLFALIVLLLFPLINAQTNFKVYNENPQAKEVYLGILETTGEIKDEITKEDFELYEGRRKVSFESNLYFYDGNYYYSVIIPREGNFTLQTKEFLIEEDDSLISYQINEEIIVKNILNEGKTKILQYNPTIFFGNNEPEIRVTNVGELSLTFNFDGNAYTLAPSQSKKVIYTPTNEKTFLEISSYKSFLIPIFYFLEIKEGTAKKGNLGVFPNSLTFSLIEGVEEEVTLNLMNLNENQISNIKISTDLSILEISEINELTSKETKTITITGLSKNKDFKTGTITIEFVEDSQTYTLEIPVEVSIFSNTIAGQELTSSEGLTYFQDKTCVELNGVLCSDTCKDGTRLSTTDSTNTQHCCVDGECIKVSFPKESKSNENLLLIIIIILFLSFISFIIYKKYKKIGVRPQFSLEKSKEKPSIKSHLLKKRKK